MKSCEIWGDMSADRIADQYPTVTCCDECFNELHGKEDTPIVTGPGPFDPAYGEECHFCGKHADDE